MNFAHAQAWDHEPLEYDIPALSGKASFTRAANETVAFTKPVRRALHLGSLSAMKRIDALGRLPDDWDGNGSPPASVASVANAQEWFTDIHRLIAASNLDWWVPHFSVSEIGEVVFEWWRADRKMSMYFDGAAATYLKVWGPNVQTQMEDGPIELNKTLSLWTWLDQ